MKYKWNVEGSTYVTKQPIQFPPIFLNRCFHHHSHNINWHLNIFTQLLVRKYKLLNIKTEVSGLFIIQFVFVQEHDEEMIFSGWDETFCDLLQELFNDTFQVIYYWYFDLSCRVEINIYPQVIMIYTMCYPNFPIKDL